MNYLVGLTGGIGSGKSTIADMFAAHGVRIVDADLISHQLTQSGGKAMPAIRDTFGMKFIDNDGALMRSKMRQTIFSDPHAKRRLESILHPLILDQCKQISASPTDAPYTLIVIPLLFESGHYADWLNRVITVDCSEVTQITRTMQRSKMDEASVHIIMENQLSRTERKRLADGVILNDGSLQELEIQIAKIHRHMSVLAAENH